MSCGRKRLMLGKAMSNAKHTNRTARKGKEAHTTLIMGTPMIPLVT
jgi:hypothetical protein